MIVVLSFGVCGVLFVRSKGWVLEVLVVIGYGYSAVVYLVILWVMCRWVLLWLWCMVYGIRCVGLLCYVMLLLVLWRVYLGVFIYVRVGLWLLCCVLWCWC